MKAKPGAWSPTVRKYLLIPLDDTVVFPNMSGDAAARRRLTSSACWSCRAHEGDYAKVGTVAEVGRGRPPARRRAAS